MQTRKTLAVIAGIAASFIGLAATIIFLLKKGIVTVEMAKLMLVALLAIYVGFGFFVVVYRFIGTLK